MNNRLAVNLPGLSLKNPIMPSSGSVYYGLDDVYEVERLGALVTKTTTLDERAGNPQPWIINTPAGILNSVGLANPGVNKVIKEFLPKIAEKYSNLPVMFSIAGETVQDYVRLTKYFDDIDTVSAIEANLSCPNVDRGGIEFGVSAESAAEVIAAMRQVTKKPIYAKMSPNVTDIKPIVKAVELAGADGLVLINTLVGMSLDLDKREPSLARGIGGLSGTAIHPIAVRFVYEAAQTVDIPIIGVGGVTQVEDALELLMAGASAVQVGSAIATNPTVMTDIIAALPKALDKYGFTDVTEVTRTFKKS
ncbi:MULTISPECIES: dihydroorotate dehydrogenase [Leuconostoc]|uniref:Dihydroorotate dehydrogenase n=1 Tax=Leuconostoc pseudomesenteroides TaxID=33968 RepID=A0A1X0VFW6_LEUPS|nr:MULTISPECIES: dihydroorotate dehydrogenase [Leuconostoc]KDA48373.1 Dihydroorotate dehydrogenase, catalytic subunit [Leuconostoc pseudomesenteroides 1159]KDA50788.1 Dihydroorotate dehydrogenase [Leuconostoc pseudomesenteroides PS12]MCT4418625.1 dihydroorotate dehydrogenase [Leuconostoc falkenbergense]MDG9743924.1 dihydroorotate dehydrogenase [Leuconostoc falkenbergense]OQJ67694.1 dihydroorotate dehydrogenase B catalytic subunit [Leuconostoc pseudomesenteroides]